MQTIGPLEVQFICLRAEPDALQSVPGSLSGNAKDNQFQIKSTNAL